jgi:hypothetical protein
MALPNPSDQLAGCVWLPRILAKARRLKRGTLPPDYEARFCHAGGVDGQFLSHFGLTREDMLQAADYTDAEAVAWFLSHHRPETIQKWNHIAVNLGRPGFPLAERLPVALATVYKHVDPRGITSVFEALEADEKLSAT